MMKRDFQGNIYDDCKIEKILQDIPTFNSPISSYASVDLDELMATIDRLKKIPNTNDLIKENNKLHSNWNSLRELIEQYLENEKYSYMSDNPKDRCRYDVFIEIKDKMDELEVKDKNES